MAGSTALSELRIGKIKHVEAAREGRKDLPEAITITCLSKPEVSRGAVKGAPVVTSGMAVIRADDEPATDSLSVKRKS